MLMLSRLLLLVLVVVWVSLISESPRIATNRRESPRIAANRHESPRIAANRSRLNSGANNPFRPSVAVCITSLKLCSGNVSSVVRKGAPHVLQLFLSIKHSISSTSCDVQLLNRSYGVHCSFRHARLCVVGNGNAWPFLVVATLVAPSDGKLSTNS